MIDTLYLGQQYTNNMRTLETLYDVNVGNMGSYLSFSGMNLSSNNITVDNPVSTTGSIVAKLDLLFYHRLSLTGDILTSVVMMDTPRKIDSMVEKRYTPKFIYKNTSLEKTINIPKDAKNFTMFNVLNSVSITTPFSDVSLFNGQKTALPTTGFPSVVISEDSIAKDGWYSIMSIGVCDTNVDPGFVKKGFLVQDTTNTQSGDFPELGDIFIARVDNADPTMLSDSSLWQQINVWNTTDSLAYVINCTMPYNPWIRRDIFWMAEYDKVYRDTVIDFVEQSNNFGDPYINAKALHTSISYFAKKSRFSEAQFILQGSDYYRTTHNFLA